MAAIYGSIGLSDSNNYKQYFDKYSFDDFASIDYGRVHFACFHQYFTHEDMADILPRKCENLLITCDAIIDNRLELIHELELESNVSDSMLIQIAYEKWGEDCPKHLYGDFAFAIYDIKKDQLFLARDQLGKKILYYSLRDGIFKFSTLLKGIAQNSFNHNKVYIKNMLALNMVMNNPNKTSTIYEGIFMLQPGHSLTFNNDRVVIKQFWKLKRTKKYKNFDTAIEDFKRTYEMAVRSRLRTHGEVGISLSGGLDSTSVACLAANHLANSNKFLYGYTSIADKDLDIKTRESITFDESDMVKLLTDKYENMICTFLDSKGKSAISEQDEIEDIQEQPVKFLSNGFWLNDIYHMASQDNCKVLLNGQAGNFCVSYGNIYQYYFNLLSKLKWNKFITVANNYCKKNGVGRKRFLKHLIENFTNYEKFDINNYLTTYHQLSQKEISDLASNIKSFHNAGKPSADIKRVIREMCNPILLNQMAESETKYGLKHKILLRDPTRDTRLIECCYNFDVEAFNKEGYSRTLIVEGLKDMIPEPVLSSRIKGVQGGDFVHRLIPHWHSKTKHIRGLISNNDFISEYIDVKSFMEAVECYSDISDKLSLEDGIEIGNLLSAMFVIEYIVESKKREN